MYQNKGLCLKQEQIFANGVKKYNEFKGKTRIFLLPLADIISVLSNFSSSCFYPISLVFVSSFPAEISNCSLIKIHLIKE